MISWTGLQEGHQKLLSYNRTVYSAFLVLGSSNIESFEKDITKKDLMLQ